MAAAHETLCRVNGPFGIGYRLTSCRFPDNRFFLIGECDHARRQPVAFRVGDHLGFTAFHDRDDAIGCTEVDSDYFFALGHIPDSPVC